MQKIAKLQIQKYPESSAIAENLKNDILTFVRIETFASKEFFKEHCVKEKCENCRDARKQRFHYEAMENFQPDPGFSTASDSNHFTLY